jgi:hypothetical protein
MKSPLARRALADPTRIDKLCFASCCNRLFYPGAVGLARSVRRFYSAAEASLVVFFDEDMRGLETEFIDLGCEIHWTAELESWILPTVYQRPEYAADRTHYFHPAWSHEPGLEHGSPAECGFSHIRNKHPLNVKAYCTGWCLVHEGYSRVVHIDSDAFLLSRIDDAWRRASGKDWVLGWNDGDDSIEKFERMFHAKRTAFDTKRYTFNGGVVFYRNGPGIHRLMLDFMFYIESDCHYHQFGNDQGLLRALVMYHVQEGNIQLDIAEGSCWNPTWFRADELELRGEEWFNLNAGGKQFIWHGAGGEKLWSGKYKAPGVNQAWGWIMGWAGDKR